MTKILSFCNQKGGVGKTSTVFHVARAAARAGRKTLVVDADPQGNLTKSLSAVPLVAQQAGLADVLSPRAAVPLADVVVATPWEGVDLVPTAGTVLAAVRDELIPISGREHRLRMALEAVGSAYDLVLIDTAPAIDTLTINALTASHDCVIVTEPGLYSIEGLGKALAAVSDVQKYFNAGLTVRGVVLNLGDRTLTSQHWSQEIATALHERGIPLLATISRRAAIAAAVDAQCGLDEYGDRSAKSLVSSYDDLLTTIDRKYS